MTNSSWSRIVCEQRLVTSEVRLHSHGPKMIYLFFLKKSFLSSEWLLTKSLGYAECAFLEITVA